MFKVTYINGSLIKSQSNTRMGIFLRIMIGLLNKNPGSISVTKKGHCCTVENSNYCYSLSLLDFCLPYLVLLTTEMLLSVQALLELEMNSDLKASLHELYITGAKVSASFAFFLVSSLFKTHLGKIQGNGRKFLDCFKSYFGSQISQSLNEVHIYRLQPESATKDDFFVMYFCLCFESASQIADGEQS